MKIDRVSITFALFVLFSIAALIYTIFWTNKKPQPIPDIPIGENTYSDSKIENIVKTFNKSYYSLNPKPSTSQE